MRGKIDKKVILSIIGMIFTAVLFVSSRILVAVGLDRIGFGFLLASIAFGFAVIINEIQ